MAIDAPQSDYAQSIASWTKQASLMRRLLARVGIEGKLILGFLILMAVALVGSGWAFWSAGRHSIAKLTGDRAVELSQMLAQACEPALARNDKAELSRIAHDLTNQNGIGAVAVFDSAGKPVAVSTRDPGYLHDSEVLATLRYNVQRLSQVRQQWTAALGYFSEVAAPVLYGEDGQGARLIGYVSVSISSESERQLLQQMNWRLAIVGALVLVLSLPLVSWLVHRIFVPIRELVSATLKIADGDLAVGVAVHRPDVIGTLARSFNQMVRRVRDQQAALHDANRDLEDRIRQRTAQLETANGRLSSEIAEKETFLRTVSHDLSAPLRNISGMASMLVMKYRDRFDDDIMHRLERIQKNVEVESDLIAELLELSRIKTRRQKMEPVDLEQTLKDLAGMFENDLKTKNIALILETPPLPVVIGERARFRQIFQNLIDNAIKYMGEGPRREIRVGWTRRPGEAEFHVTDSGIGIEPQDVEQVFCVFRRGKNAARNATGKGVGLASVKSIVEMYNGTIWVTSEVGKGSAFRFTMNGRFLGPAEDEMRAAAA